MAGDTNADASKRLKESAKRFVIKSLQLTDHELGTGSYGAVRIAVYQGKDCVVKEIYRQFQNSQAQQRSRKIMDDFWREINTLSTLRHPCIVQFLGIYFQDDTSLPLLVMERMHQNLATFVTNSPNLSPLSIIRILHDVACGLAYLHSKDVIHRDLKADNILLTKSDEAKIGDLGVAKVMQKYLADQKMTKKPGNEAHMPPEALTDNPKYTIKLDIFSFGCVIIYTVVREVALPTEAFRQLDSHDQPVFQRVPEVIRREKHLQKMDHVSCLRDLAMECLANEPDKRPEADDLAGKLKAAMDDMKQNGDVHSESKRPLVHNVTNLQQVADQNGRWKTTTYILLLLIVLLFVAYLFHWINICHEYEGCSEKEQQCRPLFKLENTVSLALGSARDTVYSLYHVIRG